MDKGQEEEVVLNSSTSSGESWEDTNEAKSNPARSSPISSPNSTARADGASCNNQGEESNGTESTSGASEPRQEGGDIGTSDDGLGLSEEIGGSGDISHGDEIIVLNIDDITHPRDIEAVDRAAAARVKALHREFLEIVRDLPERFSSNVEREAMPTNLEVIGKITYGDDKELLESIQNDHVLAMKLWNFVMDSSSALLKDVLDQKKALVNSPASETYRMLRENAEPVRLAFSAIINFVVAGITCITPENYGEIVRELSHVWYEGCFDEFDRLSYSALENLTNDKSRSEYLIESGTLSLARLVERTRKYTYDSPQFAGILSCIQNLCQVPSVQKDLVNAKLENEPEIYMEFLIPVVRQGNPDEVRVAISGILKNLAMNPETHSQLLDKKLDFLSYALEPIAASGEYSDEELMNLPLTLYGILLNDGEIIYRDPEPLVRKNTLEFMYQMCSVRTTRESFRTQHVYSLLREYHKCEQDEELVELIEQVVNLLIQTEDEIGVANLQDLAITASDKETA